MVTLVALALNLTLTSEASGKKKPAPVVPITIGKKTVALHPLKRVQITLPNDEPKDFGPDFQARLTTILTRSGKYIVTDPLAIQALEAPSNLDPVWPSSTTPAVDVRVDLQAFGFISGTRGTRMFYGFDDRIENTQNEFPLQGTQASWFGNSFEGKNDSRTGLDLGEGLHLDLLFAWLGLKYARFESRLFLKFNLDSPLSGLRRDVPLQIKGSGYFYDVVAGYGPYSAGIKLARTAALHSAFEQAVDATLPLLDREFLPILHVAKIDGVIREENATVTLLGTGRNAEVPAGTLFESGDSRYEIIRSVSSGALARLVAGTELPVGTILKKAASGIQSLGALRALEASPLQTITIPEIKLPKAPFKTGDIPKLNLKSLRSLTGFDSLEMRLWPIKLDSRLCLSLTS